MAEVSWRNFVTGAALAGTVSVMATGASRTASAADHPGGGGFMAASSNMEDGPGSHEKKQPCIQRICAVCEVTGGGEKVYGIAVEYDVNIDSDQPAFRHLHSSCFSCRQRFLRGYAAGAEQKRHDSRRTAAPCHGGLHK